MESNRIKYWRENKGIKQSELAKMMGITQGEISNIESGKRRLSLDHIKAAAQAMSLSPADILPEENSMMLAFGETDDCEAVSKSGKVIVKEQLIQDYNAVVVTKTISPLITKNSVFAFSFIKDEPTLGDVHLYGTSKGITKIGRVEEKTSSGRYVVGSIIDAEISASGVDIVWSMRMLAIFGMRDKPKAGG